MKTMLLSLFVFALLPCVGSYAATPNSALDQATNSLMGRRFMQDLSSASAKRSIRGTKALWTALKIQKPENSEDFDRMESDIRATELEGQLKNAGFKIMDPNKHSLALGLRPTLVLSVYFIPKAAMGNTLDVYLVTAEATQDVTPLGGDKISMTTWLKVGTPITSTGNTLADIEAIRDSAKACVRTFIDTAQDNDTTPDQKP